MGCKGPAYWESSGGDNSLTVLRSWINTTDHRDTAPNEVHIDKGNATHSLRLWGFEVLFTLSTTIVNVLYQSCAHFLVCCDKHLFLFATQSYDLSKRIYSCFNEF